MARKISRRRFLAGSAAAAVGVGAAGPMVMRALAAPGGGLGERLAPPGKLGVQHFSIRDAITRRSIANSVANGLTPTRGYLGGPNFPADPTDLGPLVDLPGGYIEVFAYLASVGSRASSSSSSPRTSTSWGVSRRSPRSGAISMPQG